MASSKGSKKRKKSKAKNKAAKKRAATVPKSLRKGDLPTSVADVMAAGLGALREAQSSGGTSFNALVKRGLEVQSSGTDAARDAAREIETAVDRALDTLRSAGDVVTGGIQDRVEAVVESVLLRLGVPTREEILSLQATVDALEIRLFGDSASSPARESFAVRKHDSGWAVCRGIEHETVAVRSTKKQALFEARSLARTNAPSELTVYKLDGTIGDTTTYGS